MSKMSLLKNALILFAVLLVTVNAKRVKLATGESVCACTMDWTPLCATDGVTYSNRCSFECARDEAVELGRAAITIRNENAGC